MAINGVGNDPSTTGAGAPQGMKSLDKDAFLRLLVTQMGHQNPLQPQADGEFIAQLAQFSSVEQLTGIQDTLDKIATALGVAQTPAKSSAGSSTSLQA
jgi:flagellar basal-body rod modification protein FlgD